jgi:hypothetical protein
MQMLNAGLQPRPPPLMYCPLRARQLALVDQVHELVAAMTRSQQTLEDLIEALPDYPVDQS